MIFERNLKNIIKKHSFAQKIVHSSSFPLQMIAA